VTVDVRDDAAIKTLRLNRPQKKNALSLAMYEALAEALVEAQRQPNIRVVQLLGQRGVFTAGNDIQDFVENPPLSPDSAVFRFLNSLAMLDKPLVIGVDGPAVGVGSTMLLHADVVIASDAAWFQFPFVDLGLVPEAGSSYLLPLQVGLTQASRWLMLAERVSAEQALRFGLVSEVVAPADLEERTSLLAQKLAEKQTEALCATKRLLRQPLREALMGAMREEGAIFAQRLQSPDTQGKLRAFFKR